MHWKKNVHTGNQLLVVTQLQPSVGSSDHQLLGQFEANPGTDQTTDAHLNQLMVTTVLHTIIGSQYAVGTFVSTGVGTNYWLQSSVGYSWVTTKN